MVKRLRAGRPDEDWIISLRVNIDAANVDEMKTALAIYRDAGVQHVMAAPEDRDIDTYMRTVERFARVGEGL